jgi:hypothetical protein
LLKQLVVGQPIHVELTPFANEEVTLQLLSARAHSRESGWQRVVEKK